MKTRHRLDPQWRERGHLFRCPDCRVDARLAGAWRRVRGSLATEEAQPVSESFVGRVTEAAARDRPRRRRRRALLSAAAALLFFFLAGAGHESRSSDTARIEESYAQLLAPSALESLLPD